jgi:heme o synthase
MKLRAWALAAVISTFVLVLLGAYVVKTGAGMACVKESWPFCNGRVLPPFESPTDDNGVPYFTQGQMVSEWAHRAFAGITSLLTVGLIAVTVRRYRDHQDLLTLAITAGGLLFAQVLMGAATVNLNNAPWTVVVHQGLAFLFFGILTAIAVAAWRRDASPLPAPAPGQAQPASEAPARRTGMQVLGDYLSLLKLRVVFLLLVSAVTSMLIAAGTSVDPKAVFATILGGTMAAGSGSAFNQWYERDKDKMMARTAKRPVAAGRLPGSHVLAYSASLAVGSFMVLAVFANLLAALLALAGALFYITVYTIWLKPSRPSNIVWGGAAGSFPVLVGWAAATGEVAPAALLLGFIIFLWTPPHFWSLALLYKDDYARAGIPMMPVVRGVDETKQQIFLYSVALLVCSTSFWLLDVDLSVGYLLVSMVLGALFVLLAFDLLRQSTMRPAMRLFRYSILYLGLLFLYMAVDKLWIAQHLSPLR